METKPTFSLNQAVQSWREALSTSPVFRGENLDELAEHLRESVTNLQKRGLSDEEAFLVASRRMGASGALESEYAKVNGQRVWIDRILWGLIGFQAYMVISSLTFTSGYLLDGLWTSIGLFNTPSLPILWAVLSPLMIGLLVGCAWSCLVSSQSQFRRSVESLAGRPVKLALVASCASVLIRVMSDSVAIFFIRPVLGHATVDAGWKYVVGNSLQTLPAIVVGTLLFIVLARRRLKLLNA